MADWQHCSGASNIQDENKIAAALTRLQSKAQEEKRSVIELAKIFRKIRQEEVHRSKKGFLGTFPFVSFQWEGQNGVVILILLGRMKTGHRPKQ